MRRTLAALALALALVAATAWAQTPPAPLELNRASERELDGLRGLGPATTRRILQAREQQPFADWADFMRRVRGMGGATARRLSDQGLRVEGQPLPAAPP